MAILPTKEIPKYETMLELSKRFPVLDPLSTVSFIQLLFISDELVRGVAETFQQHHVTKGKFMVLIQLFNKELWCPQERSPAELAEMANISRATVSGLLDGLEREGLVIRKPDQRDRRMVMVSLTPAGFEVLNHLMPEHFKRVQELMNGLCTEEKTQLTRLIGKLIDYLGVILPVQNEPERNCRYGHSISKHF